MSWGLDRRQVVAGGLGAGLLAGSARLTGAAAQAPFALGVASGSPSPDGFVLWTRLVRDPLAPDGGSGMDAPTEVSWEVCDDEAMTSRVAAGTALATAPWGHSLHVEVGGLSPNRPFFYRFTALGAQSPVGRARTAPAAGAPLERLRIAIASCAHYETGWFSAYRHMAAESPDLVLFLGDYIYEYSYGAQRAGLVRRHNVPGEIRDLAGYRNRYALHRLDPDLRALHQAAPCIATWDDHEVQNDYAADFSQIGTIPEAEFALRRQAAYQAFYEHMPLRASARPTAAGMRLHGRFNYGDLAEFTVLDGRQYRSIQACPNGGSRRGRVVAAAACPDLQDPARTMLGAEQEQWLYAGFRNPGARWNLIAQGLMVAPYVQTNTAGDHGFYSEGWSGYGANRNRMLAAMAESRLKNAAFFGGDLHAFMAGEVMDPAGSGVLAAEFVGTSVTSDPTPDSFRDTLALNPHVKYFENAWRGYMSAQITPRAMTVDLRAISDRTDPGATVSTLKRFVVEDGAGGLVEA